MLKLKIVFLEFNIFLFDFHSIEKMLSLKMIFLEFNIFLFDIL